MKDSSIVLKNRKTIVYFADCSLTIEEKSIIRKDLTIQKTIISYEVECDTEVEISEKSDTEYYQINNISGSIDRIR